MIEGVTGVTQAEEALSAADGSVQGFVDEHLVVPVESVNGATAAVRFQPLPDPVASSAVIVPWLWTMASNPVRVSDHFSVDGAPTDRVPAETVAVPVMLHWGVPPALRQVNDDAVEERKKSGPTASAPTIRMRPVHLDGRCRLRRSIGKPPRFPSVGEDVTILSQSPSFGNCRWPKASCRPGTAPGPVAPRTAGSADDARRRGRGDSGVAVQERSDYAYV